MTLCRNVAVGCLLLAFSAMGCGSKKPDAPKKKKDWASEPNTLATIGDSRITSDEIAHWINKGTRDAQQRYRTNSIPLRSLLETWVKDELLLAEARRLHLDEHPNLRFQIRHLLARAMEQRLHKELKPAPVTKKEIEAYYTKHQKKFHVEFLMRLQHVLVKTKAMAEKVAKEARAQEAEERKGEHGHGNPFGRLVRKYTIDEASKNIRGGSRLLQQAERKSARAGLSGGASLGAHGRHHGGQVQKRLACDPPDQPAQRCGADPGAGDAKDLDDAQPETTKSGDSSGDAQSAQENRSPDISQPAGRRRGKNQKTTHSQAQDPSDQKSTLKKMRGL